MENEFPGTSQTNMEENVEDPKIQISLSLSELYIKPARTTEDSDSGGKERPADDSIIHYPAEPSTFGQTNSDSNEKVEGETDSDQTDRESDENYINKARETKTDEDGQENRSGLSTFYYLRQTKNAKYCYRAVPVTLLNYMPPLSTPYNWPTKMNG